MYSPTPILRRSIGLTATASLLALAACTTPDPQGRFNEFADAIAQPQDAADDTAPDATTDTSTDAAPDVAPDVDPDAPVCLPAPIEPGGEYFMALHAAPFRSDPPVFVRATFVKDGDTYDITFQPLTADIDFDENFQPVPRENPRQDVGTPIVSSDVAIAADGTFTVVVTGLDVNGEANPITGSNLIGNLTMTGSFINSDEGCGTVPEGEVVGTTVVNMRNSTWTMVRMPEDPVSIDPVLRNCEELAAEPAPCIPQE